MRRARTIIGGAIVVVALTLPGLWLALPALIERMVPQALADRGFGPTTLTVEALRWDGLVLHDLSVGTAVTATTISLGWAPGRLTATTLRIEGLTLDGQWTENGLILPGLEPLFTSTGEAGNKTFPALPIEQIELPDTRLLLTTPQGPMDATADLTAALGPGGIRVTGTIHMTGPGLSANGTLDLATPSLSLTALRGDGRLTLRAEDATLPGLLDGVTGQVVLTLTAADSAFTLLAEGPLTIEATGLAPALVGTLPDDAAAMLTGALRLTTDGDIKVIARPPAANPTTAPWTTTVLGGGRIESGEAWLGGGVSAVVGITPDGIITNLAIDGMGFEAQGVRAYGATWSALLGLDKLHGIPMDARAEAIRLMVTAQNLDTGTVTARQASLNASGPMVWSGSSVRIALHEGGIVVATPATFGRLNLADDVAWHMMPSGETAALEIALAEDGGVTLLPNLTLDHPRLAARLGPTGEAAAFDITLATASIDALMSIPASPADRATAAITGGDLTAEGLTMTGIAGRIDVGGGETRINVEGAVQTLPGETAPPRNAETVRPFRVSAVATTHPGEPYLFTASLHRADGQPLADISGQHDLETGRGTARLRTPEISFSKQGLRPRDLYAPLAGVGTVTAGNIAAKGTVRWSGGTLHPDLQLLMADVTLNHQVVELDGLNGVLHLTKLWPPQSPEGQTVSVRVLKAGLPLTNGLATFHLDGTGNLVLEGASLELADGQLSASPTTIPLDLSEGYVTLTCQNLSLAALAGLTELNGLSAEGRLSGTVPVHLMAGDVIIENGRLSTPEGGILRYDPDLDPAALGGGESVDLMLKALRDFRYRQLVLTLDGSAAGDISASIHLAGASPLVYDGYPLEFNLTISGALSQILSDSLAGYQVPDRIRERMQSFQNEP